MSDRLREVIEGAILVINWVRRNAMNSPMGTMAVELLADLKAVLAESETCTWTLCTDGAANHATRYLCHCDEHLREMPISWQGPDDVWAWDSTCPGCGRCIVVKDAPR
jgi:hypothetical protein